MRVIAIMGFVLLAACGGGGTEPEEAPEYTLADLTGTWIGDSDCAIGRYRFAFGVPEASAVTVAGQAWLSQPNGAGVCTEGATAATVQGGVGATGAVSVAWPATASTRFVWRSHFQSPTRLATGRYRDETKPVSYITLPDEFGMAKQ
jgi:hypothetical protein